jgi:hypothetical protein
MCVLLCANPAVHLWFDAISIRSQRVALQTAGICSVKQDYAEEPDTLSESVMKQIPRGPMLRQPYWPRHDNWLRSVDPSLETWKHPLDALAYAWCRLLVLVGLRR